MDIEELIRRRERRLQRNRLRWGVVLLAVAVTVAGHIAEPYVHDWYAARACDGVSVDGLVPDGDHLEDGSSSQVDGIGWYSCEIDDTEETLVDAVAYTRRDDQDRMLLGTFKEIGQNNGFRTVYPLPDRLPGYITEGGSIQLMVPCPGLGKDSEGRPRSMLASVRVGENSQLKDPKAPYRLATAFTGTASRRLGCGAEPLQDPAVAMPFGTARENGKVVRATAAKGTACSWAADVVDALPHGRDWTVGIEANGAAPVERCDLRGPGFSAGSPFDWDTPSVDLVAWYGDWIAGMTDDENGTPRPMTAHARCAGQDAGFALRKIGSVGSTVQKRLLTAFTEDQVRRRHCTEPRYTN